MLQHTSVSTQFGSGLHGGGTDFTHRYLRACAGATEVRGECFAALFLDAVSAFASVCRRIALPAPETIDSLAKRLAQEGFDAE